MTGEADRHNDGPDRLSADTLDPVLQRAFDEAFVEQLPVDVGARHLWQLYRSARPDVVDGLAAAPRPGQLRRLAAMAAIGLIAFVLPGLVTQMSQDALPGDPLYAVKRAHEQAQVAHAISWEQRDAILFSHAELRVVEAEVVARLRPRRASQAITAASDTISRLSRSPVEASRTRAEEVRSEATERLASVAAGVDDDTRQLLLAAIEAVATPEPAGERVNRSRMIANAVDASSGGASQPGRTDAAAGASAPAGGDDAEAEATPDVEADTGTVLAAAAAGASTTPDAGPSPVPDGGPATAAAAPSPARTPATAATATAEPSAEPSCTADAGTSGDTTVADGDAAAPAATGAPGCTEASEPTVDPATGQDAPDDLATDDPATDDPATGDPATDGQATGEPATDGATAAPDTGASEDTTAGEATADATDGAVPAPSTTTPAAPAAPSAGEAVDGTTATPTSSSTTSPSAGTPDAAAQGSPAASTAAAGTTSEAGTATEGDGGTAAPEPAPTASGTGAGPSEVEQAAADQAPTS